MSKLLNVVHASAPSAEIKHHLLELKSVAFPGGSYRWVQGYNDEVFTLETGEVAVFKAMGFGVSLPERSLRGNQDIQFQVDNVTGEVLRAIDAVISSGGKIPVIYRCYLDSDKTTAAQPAIEMTATAVSANYKSVNVIADFHDFVNRKWPTLRYTPDLAPGLKYL
ncbi:MAG: DUF1833 family protein [Cycloclasticus sp.]|jgi:Domain of unknown function (DUF1833).